MNDKSDLIVLDVPDVYKEELRDLVETAQHIVL